MFILYYDNILSYDDVKSIQNNPNAYKHILDAINTQRTMIESIRLSLESVVSLTLTAILILSILIGIINI